MTRGGRVAAALAATLALAAGGCGEEADRGGAAPPGAAAPLAWEGEPRVLAATAPAVDRVLTGLVRNRSRERIDLDARKVELRARDGSRVEGAATFLSTFVRDRYARNRPENLPPDEERRLSGSLARIEPGKAVPITVAWRARPGVPRPVVVRLGPVALPVPEAGARHAP